jgi:hypothetical protein
MPSLYGLLRTLQNLPLVHHDRRPLTLIIDHIEKPDPRKLK